LLLKSFFVEQQFSDEIIDLFHQLSKGYWRKSRTIAETAHLIMAQQGAKTLTPDILNTAYMYCYANT
jgi:hypothetical protein